MARTFHRRRSVQPIAELNVTNLIDLGFTLLIIFMIATPLITQEQAIPVNLPQDASAQSRAPNPDDTFQTITVQADGSYSLGTRRVTLDELDRELAAFAAQATPPVIELRLDADATAQQFVSVISALKQYNLSRVQFPTQLPQ